jgi:MtN3 and saliva related transmembrane protein
MTILATLATIFGIVNGFANLPQIYKVFKTKSAKDLSITTYVLLTVGSIVWVLYGIEIMNFPILVMNGLALAEFILLLFGCYLYGSSSK